MGCVIHYFEIQPFIVTLAGMFLARGLCYAITVDAVSITKPDYVAIAEHTFTLPGDMYVTTAVLVSLVAVLVGIYVLHYTRLGRNVYAIGGNAQSALLMGLPVGRTRIAVYTISGFCSALGGVMLSFYMLSGSGSLAVGMELDAIAAVVIGGTLLTGGIGYLAGTVLGVARPGSDPDADQLPGNVELVVDENRDRAAPLRVHPPPATRLPPQEELVQTIPATQSRDSAPTVSSTLRAHIQRDPACPPQADQRAQRQRSGSRSNQVEWSQSRKRPETRVVSARNREHTRRVQRWP